MNKWGIGLLIVNILAAAGVAYLALEDRSKRRDIQDAITRHYLTLHGLPVDGAKSTGDSADVRVETANGVPVDHVPAKLVQTYLEAAPGGARFGASAPVANQLEEVNRVVAQVNAAAGAMGPKEKLDFLAGSFAAQGGRSPTFIPGILAYLAQSADERDAARKLAKSSTGPNAAADAAKALELFSQKAAEASAPGADAIVRKRVAQFLTGLEPTSDDWQKRVALVVGLRSYVKALSEQELAFQEIASRVTRLYEDDQAAFVSQYQQLMQLSIQRSLLLSRQEEIKTELDNQQQKDAELLNMKQAQREKSAKAHDDLVKDVAAQSATNAALETAIHTTQRTVGRMLDDLLKLEADLDAAEQQRSKGR